MGKECEEKGNESELSLELSIGGSYGKSEGEIRENNNNNIKSNDNDENGILRSEFCYGIGDEILDLQRRKETQAMKRQEARKKREEKVKKSRGLNGNFGFVEDKVCLEAQRFQGRVADREIRVKNGFSEELSRKKLDNNDLNLCLFTRWNGFCENPFGVAASNNDSLEHSSSAVSDSQKGDSNTDTGSHSRNTSVHPESYESSSQREPEPELVLPPKSSSNPQSSRSRSNPHTYIDQTNNTCSTAASDTSGGLNAAPSILRMPCVSTTGNGPNGKTINGFLYKYTNTEVKILCVCHGKSFSPAKFVEHAGGVDVSHPLRHITVVPTGSGC